MSRDDMTGPMRKLFVATGWLSCIALVFGCQFLKKKDDGDAAADATAAAVVEAEAGTGPTAEAADAEPAPAPAPAPAPTAVTAKNSADVARFPGETAIEDDDMKLASAGIARAAPKSGAIVATIQPGTDVTKVAEYQNSILVTFADPKDASSTLMGWIGKESFTVSAVKRLDAGVRDASAPVDAGGKVDPKKLTCPLGMVAVVLSKDPTCRKRCTKDSDCKGGAAGACGPASTVAGTVAKVCVAGQ